MDINQKDSNIMKHKGNPNKLKLKEFLRIIITI